MKLAPPPFLIGATLLFWGWQSDFLVVGAIMAVIFEAGRWTKIRWDLSNEDFTRIWIFCTFLFLATVLIAFTANEGPSEFRGLLQNPSYLTQRNAGAATARTAASLFRWMPMVFFLFVVAQAYSTREGVPLETISLILQRRWKKARQAGQVLPPGRPVNVSFFYFAMCLFSASVHPAGGNSFFWGLCGLIGWALWTQRSRRFALPVWLLCFGTAVTLGYYGQVSMGQLQSYLGNLNPAWLSNFGRKRFDPSMAWTQIGRVGRSSTSPKIVIRLESVTGAPPPLLREASYRHYRSRAWSSNVSDKDFLSVLEETNRGNWVLVRDKTNTVSVRIGCYLEGGKALLPLPTGVARLESLSAYTLSRSPLGAVLAEGPGVVVFDALYGSGVTLDDPPDLREDLQLPSGGRRGQSINIKGPLDQVLREAGITTNDSPAQVIRSLTGFFAQNFKYSTWQEPRGDASLENFLLNNRSGHCEYFATAGTLLLRRAGVPARYAVGYAVQEKSAEGKFVVRQRDGHAWCLVWDEKRELWRDVDFTPADALADARVLSWRQKLADGWNRLKFEISRFRWGQSHLRQYLLWALVPILLALLYQIVRNSTKRRRQQGAFRGHPTEWPGLDSEFYELEKRLVRRGLVRQTSEPLSDWLERATRDPALADLSESLRQLLRMHYRYRFDPRGLTAAERATLKRQVRLVLDGLERTPVAAG